MMRDASLPRTTERLRPPSLSTSVVVLFTLLIAWALANSKRPEDVSIVDTSITHRIVVSGAIPWCLQLAATLCVLNSCRKKRPQSGPELRFTAMFTATAGVIWWVGIALTYHGLNPLEALAQTVTTAMEQQFTGEEGLPYVFLYRIWGPLISVFQLRGLLSLAGADFFYSLASLSLLTGYLTCTASVCHVGHSGHSGHSGSTDVRDVVRFVFMISIVFIPSLIRFAIDVSQMLP